MRPESSEARDNAIFAISEIYPDFGITLTPRIDCCILNGFTFVIVAENQFLHVQWHYSEYFVTVMRSNILVIPTTACLAVV